MALLPAASADTGLDAIFTGTMYLSLHTATPGTTGTSEATGGSYARQLITFSVSASGSKTSSDLQTFSNMPAETGGIPYFGIWTAVTAGTYLGGGTVSGVSSLAAGDGVSVASTAVVLSMS